jgi:hypothetical protein
MANAVRCSSLASALAAADQRGLGPPYEKVQQENFNGRNSDNSMDCFAGTLLDSTLVNVECINEGTAFGLASSMGKRRPRGKPGTTSCVPASDLSLVAQYICDNKWLAFIDHMQNHPRDARLADPRTGRPLLYHAIDLHRNNFARYLLAAYEVESAAWSEFHSSKVISTTTVIHHLDEMGPECIRDTQESTINCLDFNGKNLCSTSQFNSSSRNGLSRDKAESHPICRIRDFEGNTALIAATYAKNHDMCASILAIWPNALHTSNVKGISPLLAAASSGSELLVRAFLSRGSSLSHTDIEGNSALHLAAASNHFGVAALLVARGANFMARNKRRWTPMDYAYSETLQGFLHDLVRDVVLGDEADEQDLALAAARAAEAASLAVPSIVHATHEHIRMSSLYGLPLANQACDEFSRCSTGDQQSALNCSPSSTVVGSDVYHGKLISYNAFLE